MESRKYVHIGGSCFASILVTKQLKHT